MRGEKLSAGDRAFMALLLGVYVVTLIGELVYMVGLAAKQKVIEYVRRDDDKA